MTVIEASEDKVLSCDESCGECDNWDDIIATVLHPQAMGPEDAAPYVCPSCHVTVTQAQKKRLISGELVTCSCGEKFETESADLKVLPTSAPLMSEEFAKDAIWYHATVVPNWHEAVSEAGVYVHAGSRAAALERAADKFFPYGQKITDRTIYLWKLSINSDAVVASDILSDENQWPTWVTGCTQKHLGGDVQRYLNRWESPGSISVLADPRAFNVISVKEVRDKDCARYIKRLFP